MIEAMFVGMRERVGSEGKGWWATKGGTSWLDGWSLGVQGVMLLGACGSVVLDDNVL